MAAYQLLFVAKSGATLGDGRRYDFAEEAL
jgi:hypothetical protein